MSFTNFTPRRPVKSFLDLEVYQKLLAVSVATAKRVKNEKIVTLALDLPAKIATAHSLRFSDFPLAVSTLELAMLDCNLLIVKLEQHRDIENPSTSSGQVKIEPEFFEEQIKSLLSTRFKIMHLQQSWKKFQKDYQSAK